MTPFELYEPSRSNSRGRGTPVLRVLSGGRLVLNAAATRLLEGTTHVLLLWNAEDREIGIKPTEPSDPKAFRVTLAPSQAVITSRGFVQEHELPYSARMPVRWDGEMWIASTRNLAEPLS